MIGLIVIEQNKDFNCNVLLQIRRKRLKNAGNLLMILQINFKAINMAN